MIKASTYTSIPMASDIDNVRRLRHYLCDMVVAEDGSSHISMLPNAAEICATCGDCAYGRKLVEMTKPSAGGPTAVREKPKFSSLFYHKSEEVTRI